MMTDSNDVLDGSEGLTRRQIIAITAATRLGKKLVVDHPEIADLYRAGKTLPDIVQELDILSEYDVRTSQVAEYGVRLALRGYDGGFGDLINVKSYEGLITDSEELEDLCLAHQTEGGHEAHRRGVGVHGMSTEERREIGRKLHSDGKGIHAQTEEQYQELGRRTGGVHGPLSYEKGIGVHALGREQLQEIGRKAYEQKTGIHAMSEEALMEARLKGVEARGRVRWTLEETKRAYELSENPDYHHKKGRRKGSPDLTIISAVLNDTFHDGKPIRNRIATSSRLVKYRMSLQNEQ